MERKIKVNRREFLAAAGGAVALRAASSDSGAAAVRIAVDRGRRLGAIPADFTGLGYEISSVARPGLLSARNETYVRLVKTLGSSGVIRVGGNTSDYSSFAPKSRAISSPTGTVVNSEGLRELAGFLEATGWRLIWGLNLGSGDRQQILDEAAAVAAACKDKLLAFEIGNEPDQFGGGHRPSGYRYDDYLKEYRSYKAAVRSKLPDAPFAGPDVAGATDWVTRFAADEGSDLKLLTHHYYRECAGATSSLEKLLLPDPKLVPQLERQRAASVAAHVPYRICETNSFCGGGKPGVSDTFGAALWVLDFMFTLASYDCAGVNMETGVNQMGFISSYSPVGDDDHGAYSAKPEYYGMLAFAPSSRGEKVAVNCDAAGLNLTSYAVDGDSGLTVTIVNKDESRDAEVAITGTQGPGDCRALRLVGPSLQSRNGITLGGAAVDSKGDWKPRVFETVANKGGQCEIGVPAGSAVILSWRA